MSDEKYEGGYSIMFHYFHNHQCYKKVQGSFSADELTSIIHSDEYNILSPIEWLEKFSLGKLRSNDVFLSFDDGLKEQFDIAVPILNQNNIKALFNIYTEPIFENKLSVIEKYRYIRNYEFDSLNDFYLYFFEKVSQGYNIDIDKLDVGNYLSDFKFYSKSDIVFRFIRDVLLKKEFHSVMQEISAELRIDDSQLLEKIYMNKHDVIELQNTGHLIGLHSHSHSTLMNTFDYESSLYEYSKNKKFLESLTNAGIIVAGYPLGKYNSESIKALKKIGVKYAFESKRTNNSSAFKLSRVDVADVLVKR